MGGFFFDFEAIRTESSDRDAPRRQDRAYRLGQMREVRVYKLVSRGTIEELTLMRQLYKNKVTGSAIEAKQTKGEYADRRFKGVKGKRDGELFGLGNLLKYSEDSSFLNDILEAEGDEIDEDQLGEKLSEKKDDVHVQELMGQREEEEAAKEAESKADAKAPAKAPASSRKHSAKAPMTAADDDAAPAPAAPKRSSTASVPWGDVTKDEADVKVGGDDWASSSDED